METTYFDRIRISSKEPYGRIFSNLPIDSLKAECKSFSLHRLKYKRSAFKTSLHLTAPTQICLEILHRYEDLLWPYCISYIELAEDTPCKTPTEAINKTEKMQETLLKKYSGGNIFDGLETDKLKKGKYPDATTLYTTTKCFSHVLYPAPSKIDGGPCKHREWRIFGAGLIQKKTRLAFFSR